MAYTRVIKNVPASEVPFRIGLIVSLGGSARFEQENGSITIYAEFPDSQEENVKKLEKQSQDKEASDNSYRVADSLIKLLDTINLIAPNRNKASDGTIGDLAHQSKDSDHNPQVLDDGKGVVTAIDITHDAANNCDCNILAKELSEVRDPRIKYIIWNKKIISSTAKPWIWRQYNGANPHDQHIHISVKSQKEFFDSKSEWEFFEFGKDFGSVTKKSISEIKIAWGKKVSAGFKKKLLQIATALNLDPSDLMAVIAFETGRTFSSSAKNKQSGATGLIQFMPKTAISLKTTIEELEAMSEVKQLDYVEKYLKQYISKIKDIYDLYMAVLWPAALGKEKSYILFSHDVNPKIYNANKGLDANDDGAVTKAEAASRVIQHLNEGLRIENVG